MRDTICVFVVATSWKSLFTLDHPSGKRKDIYVKYTWLYQYANGRIKKVNYKIFYVHLASTLSSFRMHMAFRHRSEASSRVHKENPMFDKKIICTARWETVRYRYFSSRNHRQPTANTSCCQSSTRPVISTRRLIRRRPYRHDVFWNRRRVNFFHADYRNLTVILTYTVFRNVDNRNERTVFAAALRDFGKKKI